MLAPVDKLQTLNDLQKSDYRSQRLDRSSTYGKMPCPVGPCDNKVQAPQYTRLIFQANCLASET